jgi:hypothetical protein
MREISLVAEQLSAYQDGLLCMGFIKYEQHSSEKILGKKLIVDRLAPKYLLVWKTQN